MSRDLHDLAIKAKSSGRALDVFLSHEKIQSMVSAVVARQCKWFAATFETDIDSAIQAVETMATEELALMLNSWEPLEDTRPGEEDGRLLKYLSTLRKRVGRKIDRDFWVQFEVIKPNVTRTDAWVYRGMLMKDQFTDRQQQIFSEFQAGRRQVDIAEDLGIAKTTVNTTLHRLKKKIMRTYQ